MVIFCNKCKRAVDDLDKFCRSCGQSTNDSIDYHTYYRSFKKDENDLQSLLWFIRGTNIAFQQEIKEINEKVDLMYQKLFPPSVGELREEFDRVFKNLEKEDGHKEEKPVEEPPEIEVEKKEELKKEDDIKKEDRHLQEKEEHKEEKPVEEPPEIEVEKKEELRNEDDIKKENRHLQEKEEHKEEKPVEEPPEIEVEKKEDKGLDQQLPKESSEEKEDRPLPDQDINKDANKKKDEIDVPQEVNDKLNMLLQEDEGQRQAIQYLINRYKNKDKKVGGNVDNNKSDNKSSVNNGAGPSIAIVPSEDVVRIGRARGKGKEKGEPYKMYDAAIHPFIPDILKSIENSKDGMIRVRLLDVAKKMGEKFVDKKPVTIYSGLKCSLFDHNIVVEMGSLKAVDPVTKEDIKILKMRMKNPDDTLPPSLLERRGDME